MGKTATVAFALILSTGLYGVAADDKPTNAPEDVTKWDIGMVFKFPEQTDSKYFEVGKVLDKDHMVVLGATLGPGTIRRGNQVLPGGVVATLWYPPFVLKAPTKGIIDDKRIKLEKTYKVVDTMEVQVRKFPKKTVYVIEEVK